MTDRVIISEGEYAEVLYAWLKMNIKPEPLRIFAKSIKYKISFFHPLQRIVLLEELISIYTALICFVSYYAIADSDNRNLIQGKFVGKVAKLCNTTLFDDDPEFLPRFQEKFERYTSIANEDNKKTQLAVEFMKNLHEFKSRNMPKDIAMLSATFGIFCKTLNDALTSYEIA